MTDKPKLTIRKPLSLEKQSQLFQALKPIHDGEKEKDHLFRKQKQKEREAQRKKREDIKATLKWMQEAYPLCFNTEDPHPLKIRIEDDLFAALPSDSSITKIKIKQALTYYTRSIDYFKALLKGTHRFDLEGQPVQDISPLHKAWVQERLEIVMKAIQKKKELDSLKPTTNKPLQD